MKKLLLLFSTLFIAFNLSAQNYDTFLQRAYSALEEGKIEIAQSSYNIYKRMTKKTDSDFETLLKDADVNGWKKDCHIIIVNDTLSLAVQHIDKQQVPVSYHVAEVKTKASRLGNFTDWRLPVESELYIILPNISFSFQNNESYCWIQHSSATAIIRKKAYTDPAKVTDVFSSICFRAMHAVSYEVMETYFEHKTNNVVTEIRGNKDVCHNYLIVRSFNPNK